MNPGLERTLFGLGGAALAGALVVGLYELSVVPQLQADVATAVEDQEETQEELEFAQELVGVGIDAQVACTDAVNLLHDTLTTVVGASQEKTDAVDDFFDRYSYLAGNSSSLGSRVFRADTTIESAVDDYIADPNYEECLN